MAYTHFRLFLIKRRAAPEHIIAHYHAGGTIGTNQTLSFELLPELPRFSAEDYPVVDGSTANLPLSYMLSDHIRQHIRERDRAGVRAVRHVRASSDAPG